MAARSRQEAGGAAREAAGASAFPGRLDRIEARLGALAHGEVPA